MMRAKLSMLPVLLTVLLLGTAHWSVTCDLPASGPDCGAVGCPVAELKPAGIDPAQAVVSTPMHVNGASSVGMVIRGALPGTPLQMSNPARGHPLLPHRADPSSRFAGFVLQRI